MSSFESDSDTDEPQTPYYHRPPRNLSYAMPEARYKPLDFCRQMRWWEWVLAVVMILAPLAGGFVGARVFNTGIYKRGEFEQPPFSPPSWLFSPVWSILYLMMGFASFLVLKSGGGFNRETVPPLVIYLVHLIINWLWTPMFFGFGMFAMALADIGAMWALVFACIITFINPSLVAALLMIPYFLWLSFAMVLNYSIVCLNGASFNTTNTTWGA